MIHFSRDGKCLSVKCIKVRVEFWIETLFCLLLVDERLDLVLSLSDSFRDKNRTRTLAADDVRLLEPKYIRNTRVSLPHETGWTHRGAGASPAWIKTILLPRTFNFTRQTHSSNENHTKPWLAQTQPHLRGIFTADYCFKVTLQIFHVGFKVMFLRWF